MRDLLLMTIILVFGFGFTLGKLAYDDWHVRKEHQKSKGRPV
jgi:hypothetical protein